MSVTTDPPFVDPGGMVNVSARLLNAVNLQRQASASFVVRDANGQQVFASTPVPTELTVQTSLTTVALGTLDTTGFAPGNYTIEVTLTDTERPAHPRRDGPCDPADRLAGQREPLGRSAGRRARHEHGHQHAHHREPAGDPRRAGLAGPGRGRRRGGRGPQRRLPLRRGLGGHQRLQHRGGEPRAPRSWCALWARRRTSSKSTAICSSQSGVGCPIPSSIRTRSPIPPIPSSAGRRATFLTRRRPRSS